MVSRRAFLAVPPVMLLAGCGLIPERDLRSRGVAEEIVTQRFGADGLNFLRIEGQAIIAAAAGQTQRFTRAEGWRPAAAPAALPTQTFTLGQVNISDPARAVISTRLTLDHGVLVVEGGPNGPQMYAEGIEDPHDPVDPESFSRPVEVERRMLTPRAKPVIAPDSASRSGLQKVFTELESRCSHVFEIEAGVAPSSWKCLVRGLDGGVLQLELPAYADWRSAPAADPQRPAIGVKDLRADRISEVVRRGIDRLSHDKTIVIGWSLDSEGIVVQSGRSGSRAPAEKKFVAELDGSNQHLVG